LKKRKKMSKQRVYLDYAASTPMDEEVKKELINSLDTFSNASSQYQSGRNSKQILDEARKGCAKFLQCNFDEIIFTSGSTESNNIAILGVAYKRKIGRIISIATEHSSIREPLESLKNEGYDVVFADVDAKGVIDMNSFMNLLNEDTILVTVSFASSEIGTIQPINNIGQAIKVYNSSHNTRILLHADGSAAAICLTCDVARLGIDLLTIGASKIYGPKGIGILYVKRGTEIKPLNFGGGQEYTIRPGTEPVYLASAMNKCLDLVSERKKSDSYKFKELHDGLLSLLEEKNINYIYNGHKKNRLNNIFSISLPGQNGEDLVATLDAEGYEVSTGAACEANNEEPSRALMAIGLSREEAQSSLRISFGRDTQKGDLRGLAIAISDIIQPK